MFSFDTRSACDSTLRAVDSARKGCATQLPMPKADRYLPEF